MTSASRPKRARAPWLAALACLGAGAATPALAEGGASCAVAATPLAFGRYVPFSGSPSDFTATITVVCTASGTTPVPIRGTVSLAGSSGRQLSNGAHRLRYQLYLDPARTVPWGDGTGGTGTASFSDVVGAAAPYRETLTVYGRILARQSDASVGTYANQIVVVLNY